MDDITLLRSAVTVCAFIAFIGIWAWAWAPKNKARFEQVAKDLLDEQH